MIEQGGTKVAVVACDLVSLPRDLSEEAQAIVGEEDWACGGSHHDQLHARTHYAGHPDEPTCYNLNGEPTSIPLQSWFNSCSDRRRLAVAVDRMDAEGCELG